MMKNGFGHLKNGNHGDDNKLQISSTSWYKSMRLLSQFDFYDLLVLQSIPSVVSKITCLSIMTCTQTLRNRTEPLSETLSELANQICKGYEHYVNYSNVKTN